MPDTAYQLLEIVGTSTVSSDDAIRHAVERAARLDPQPLDWFQVLETRGQIRDGQVTQFQVILKVGRRLARPAAP